MNDIDKVKQFIEVVESFEMDFDEIGYNNRDLNGMNFITANMADVLCQMRMNTRELLSVMENSHENA
ncbi:hypothetical protein ACTOI6_19075 (plasmid) [Komagataeibacter intermedius]|uniref:hypothetical protein n=1 Tax=Komagataeibacter intermedius TaxID=66229 RepID=UPI0040370278